MNESAPACLISPRQTHTYNNKVHCVQVLPVFLCLRLLEKHRHYVIGLSERVKECKSVNATGIPNGILSKADANPRLTEI